MKILVTGSNGQLGQELRQFSVKYPFHEFLFTDIAELNITDYTFVDQFIQKNKPEVIINCAGYTAVDKAETETEFAMELNAKAVGHLAGNAAASGAIFIHISTDYVFNGAKSTPYNEEDIPDPQSAYATTKYEGELETIRNASRGLIIRTSWLYSEFMHNFVKTIIFKGVERGMLNVVYDQVGTPTYARDLAGTLMSIVPQLDTLDKVDLYHYSNEGVASWYDFATAIVEYSGIRCRINPILTAEYPLPAKRPFYSLMDKSKIKKKFGIEIPYWRNSLKECIQKIKI